MKTRLNSGQYQGKSPRLSNTIFVGGLSPEAEDADLYQYFSVFGPIQSSSVRISYNGKSKRFGFVTFTCRQTAMQVVLNRVHIILNKMVTVELAQEPSNKILALQSKLARKLYVGSIPSGTDKADLIAFLSEFGPLEKLTRLRTKDDHTMYCYVLMQTKSDASRLLELKSVYFGNKACLTIKPFTPQYLVREESKQGDCAEMRSSRELLRTDHSLSPEHKQLYKFSKQQLHFDGLDAIGQPECYQTSRNSNLKEGNKQPRLDALSDLVSQNQAISNMSFLGDRGGHSSEDELLGKEFQFSRARFPHISGEKNHRFIPDDSVSLANYRFNIKVEKRLVETRSNHHTSIPLVANFAPKYRPNDRGSQEWEKL